MIQISHRPATQIDVSDKLSSLEQQATHKAGLGDHRIFLGILLVGSDAQACHLVFVRLLARAKLHEAKMSGS